jgi:hypothetical protein
MRSGWGVFSWPEPIAVAPSVMGIASAFALGARADTVAPPIRCPRTPRGNSPQIGVDVSLHGVVFDIFVLGPAGPAEGALCRVGDTGSLAPHAGRIDPPHRIMLRMSAPPPTRCGWRSQQDSNLQPTE